MPRAMSGRMGSNAGPPFTQRSRNQSYRRPLLAHTFWIKCTFSSRSLNCRRLPPQLRDVIFAPLLVLLTPFGFLKCFGGPVPILFVELRDELLLLAEPVLAFGKDEVEEDDLRKTRFTIIRSERMEGELEVSVEAKI